MASSPIPWSFASLVLAGCTAYLAWQLNAERQAAVHLRAEVAEIQSRLRAPPGRATPANPPALLAEGSTGPTGPLKPPSAGPSVDPAARDALRRQQLLSMRRMFPDLARTLDLTPEQAEQFLAATVDQQLRAAAESRDWVATGAVSSPAGSQALRRRYEELQRQGETELSAQFGEPAVQRFNAYQESLPARQEVRNLHLDLLDAGMPLTQEQRQALVEAYTREQRLQREANRQRPAQNPGPDPMAQATASMQRALEVAEQRYQRLRSSAVGMLTAEQLARFDEQQRTQIEFQRLAVQSMRGGGQTGSSAPRTGP